MERYQKGIIVGGTGLLYQAADLLEQSGRVNQIELYFCNRNGFGKKQKETIRCRQLSGKKELMDLLSQESEKTLVLSVMNPWLFTQEVLCNENLLVVNLHHALLPAHRGRNAEAWAIYEGDEKAGITWHKVDAGVDTGAVYLQKEMEVDDSMTSIKLLTRLNEAALEGLKELLQEGFSQRELIKQEPDGSCPHLAKEIPNGGWLDLSWDLKQTSRFLRAMDYGIMNVLGSPKVRLGDGVYVCKSWRIIESKEETKDGIEFSSEERKLCIRKEGTTILLKNMKKMESETDGNII